MVGQAAAAGRVRRRAGRAQQTQPRGGGRLGPLGAMPVWLLLLGGAVLLVLLLGGGGWYTYRSLDRLYPQELWKYFRPPAPAAAGSLLYRDSEGQLLLAPLADPSRAQRLLDSALGPETREIVRDAVALPAAGGARQIAYYASEKTGSTPEVDRLKLLTLAPDGTPRITQRVALAELAGEPLRPLLFVSASGRYLALTNRERTRAYYFDVASGGPLVSGSIDAPPEPMLWSRNADLLTSLVPGQDPYATSPDGRWRAAVRAGTRHAPACEEPPCEPAQELVISPATIAGSLHTPPAVIFGAFRDFAAEGWGPIPTQPPLRLYGRLVWSPDATELLFTALDEAQSRVYAITTDGKTRPRLVLENAEALDWLP